MRDYYNTAIMGKDKVLCIVGYTKRWNRNLPFRLNDNQNGHDAGWNPDEYADPIHDPNANRVTMQ